MELVEQAKNCSRTIIMQKIFLMPAALTSFFVGSLVNIQPAQSFHFGGVGSCNSCHTMHDAKDGTTGSRSNSLLLASDPSSVCLNCHAGYGGPNSPSVFSPDGSAMSPGGDFYWLTKTFTWSGGTSPGDSHGHNVVAKDYNLSQDSNLTQSPGGSYQSADLGCTSCHDPHGKAKGGTSKGAPPVSVSGSYGEQPVAGTIRGNYRLLGDGFYAAGRGFDFVYDAPVARQNINNRFGETDASHVDYGMGMSEWCGNCHQGILFNEHRNGGGFSHPSGTSETLSSEIINMYNSYINTGELLVAGWGSGELATAYLQFVPFERGINDPQSLDPTSRRGPSANSRLMCLTCHRAHASAFKSAGRWDFDAVLLAESHPSSGDGGLSGNDEYHSYYGRNIATEFGSDQGPFCEKCHGLSSDALLPGSLQEQLNQGITPLVDPVQQQSVPDPLLQDPFKP